MIPFRILKPEHLGAPRPPLRCESTGCQRSTKEGKPYCQKHVLRHAYANRVANTAELRARLARTKRRLRLGDPLVGDALVIVNEGGATIRGLARKLGLTLDRAHDAVNVLVRAGLAAKHTGRRSVLVTPARSQKEAG